MQVWLLYIKWNFSLNKDFICLSLEELERRGIMDDRDIDYLEHLEVPETSIDMDKAHEVAMEGIIGAVIHDKVTKYSDAYRQMKGWFLGIESKRQYIEVICNDLIAWLKDKNVEYRNLDLDMGTFKTWMKTSELRHWRYFFLLDDTTWHRIESDLKAGRISDLEALYTIDFKAMKDATRFMDSIDTIPELIKVVELYIRRSNTFFELITVRKIRIKAFPFQVILLGATDLRRACKKIVNLAK